MSNQLPNLSDLLKRRSRAKWRAFPKQIWKLKQALTSGAIKHAEHPERTEYLRRLDILTYFGEKR